MRAVMKISAKWLIALLLAIGAGSTPGLAQDAGFRITQPQAGVTEIADDNNNWGGLSKGTTHQNDADYQIEKTIIIPASALSKAQAARLRVNMTLQDYSFANPAIKANGLDESFELLVNGKAHVFRDDDPRFSGRSNPRDALAWVWTDFDIPVTELHAGENTFVFRKLPSEKNDDYLYIGIDASVPTRHSRASFDGGKNWQSENLNAIKAHGEYMVRLLLLEKPVSTSANWDAQQKISEQKIFGYAGRSAQNGQTVLRMELDETQFDSSQPLSLSLNFSGTPPKIEAQDNLQRAIKIAPEIKGNKLEWRTGARYFAPVLIKVIGGKSQPFSNVRFDYQTPVGSTASTPEAPTDMAPRVAAPRGKAANRKPVARLEGNGFVLENAALSARFSSKPKLRLLSLQNEFADKNILAQPDLTHLFLIEKEGRRFGAEDWQVQRVGVLPKQSVRVDLVLPNENLSAQWTASIDEKGLGFALEIKNTAAQTQTWKTAFPQIGGLQISDNADEDYYLFPYYEGLISNKNTALRTFYGGDSAWWQMTDLFSPARGAGVALRCLDETGLYKSVAFQKGTDNIKLPQSQPRITSDLMDADLGWEKTLPAANGAAMAFEYLAFTREAGKSFSPSAARLEMHSGDWKTPMQEYSQWAHRVWNFRPLNGKLKDVWQFASLGWRPETEAKTQPAMHDGKKWRTDYFKDQAQAYELMTWWEWSDKGPWKVPLDEAVEKLGQKTVTRYNYAFNAIDLATGKKQYIFNRGDYDYHQSWGGKEGLRGYAEDLRRNGILATLYTDPLLVDDNTQLAKQAPKYAVMNPYWKDVYEVPLTPSGYVAPYMSWSMCVDTEWYQKFVVEQTARIVRDTQVDGIRFDEFGIAHRPGACFNPQHKHIFAEPGHNQTLQAESLMCKNVQDAVQKIRPGFVLTAEFTGYDHLAANLDGALNYTIYNHNDDILRPVPLSIFRFFFPEHKLFMLQTTPSFKAKRFAFWNTLGTFITFYDAPYLKVLEENGDAFSSPGAEVLTPTKLPRLYANRFRSGEKTVTLLYNARRFTIDGPALEVGNDANFHYFDLLHNRELAPQNNALNLQLQPDETAAVARLSRVLKLEKTATGFSVSTTKIPAQAALVLCDVNGAEMWRAPLNAKQIALPDTLPKGAVAVKLLQGKYLLDAAELPH
jgi:hypothetical protein